MTVNRRKKNVKQRGSTTHGWGSMKKHRGAGNRGGRGMAGSGKRADHKKQSIFKEYGTSYFGRRGFNLPMRKKMRSVNVSDLEAGLPNLISKNLIKEENKKYVIDLKQLGYDKLLGGGKITKPFIITADFASQKAVERVKKAGGEVILKKEKIKE